MKPHHLLGSVAVALFAVIPVKAQILADNFNRTGDLNGSSPSTPQTSGDKWTYGTATGVASSGYVTLNSTSAANLQSITRGYTASLPFALTSGQIYTLSATVTSTAGDWLALGFQAGVANGFNTDAMQPWRSNTGAEAWGLLTPSGAVQSFAGGGTSNQNANFNGTGGSHVLSLVLDTTGTAWKYSILEDSVQVGTTFTFSTNPIIDHVFIGANDGSSGTISNFQLSTNGASAVPEPSTYGMLLGGFAMLALVVASRRVRV